MKKHNFTALTTFRGWSEEKNKWVYGYYKYEQHSQGHYVLPFGRNQLCWIEIHPDSIGVYTGKDDKDGEPIFMAIGKFGGDRVRFDDKWEWYKSEYGIKMQFADAEQIVILQQQFDDEPYEERSITSIDDFEWLLSAEVQSYWKVFDSQWEAHLKAEQ